MSKIDRIQAFVNVIEQNGFNNAAKKLKTAAGTITRQINALEAELGVRLIERTTRRFKLTDIGQAYYDEAKKLIEQLQITDNLISQSQAEPIGTLKVTAHRYFAVHYVMPHLAQFMKQYPKINLHINFSETDPNFDRDDTDLLFGTLGDGAPDLVRRRMTSGKFIFCASPEYLKKHGTPKKPEDLLQHAFITHTLRQPPDLISFRNHPPLYSQPILWLNDSQSMIDAALAHIGIIKVLDFRVQEELKRGRLIEFLSNYAELDYPIYLYYRNTRYLDPKIRVFIDFFTQKLPDHSK